MFSILFSMNKKLSCLFYFKMYKYNVLNKFSGRMIIPSIYVYCITMNARLTQHNKYVYNCCFYKLYFNTSDVMTLLDIHFFYLTPRFLLRFIIIAKVVFLCETIKNFNYNNDDTVNLYFRNINRFNFIVFLKFS